MRMSFVNHALAMSVEPTPKAKHPSHGGHVLVREPHVSHGKERIARLHCLDTDLAGGDERMTGDDFFHDIHRAVLSVQGRRRNFTGESSFVVIEKPAVLDN